MYNYIDNFNPLTDCCEVGIIDLQFFTCWDCFLELDCKFAFDCYNTNYNCLGFK
jgi:hypothetical protein